MKGAPIRFVAGALGGWACLRIAVLLPGDSPLDIAADVLAPPVRAATRTGSRPTRAPATIPPLAGPSAFAGRPDAPHVRAAPAEVASAAEPSQVPETRTESELASHAVDAPPVLVPVTLGPATAQSALGRFGGSAWLLARGGANGTVSGGMLGASQAGARITYALDRGRRIALSARIATPLRGRGTEAAVGIDWQPTRAPVHLLAEQRVGLDGARGGPTVMAIAGLNPVPLAAGFRLEAYAQGGAIWRGGRAEAFGDGAARLARPVLAIGGTRLDLGAGIWAAGQRGAGRVDAGPTVGLALPVAGRRLRVSADWRQRIAGDARPGSGPALSIGTDF